MKYIFFITKLIILYITINLINYNYSSYLYAGQLAYFNQNCPSGWQDISNDYRGYIAIGATSNIGTKTSSSFSSLTEVTHTHTINSNEFCIDSDLPTQNCDSGCSIIVINCAFGDSALRSLSAGSVCESESFDLDDASPNIPLTQLRLCEVVDEKNALDQQYEIPKNMVTYFNTSFTECPEGYDSYGNAVDRAIIATNGTFPEVSDTINGYDFEHSHLLSKSTQLPQDGTNGGLSSDYADTENLDVDVSHTVNDDIEIPTLNLLACKSTVSVTSGSYPNTLIGTMMFTSTSECPDEDNWELVTDENLLDRFLVTLPSNAINLQNGKTFGADDNIIIPNDKFTHKHTVPETSLDITKNGGDTTNWESGIGSGCTTWVFEGDSESVIIDEFDSDEGEVTLPYVALGLCISTTGTQQPTFDPTNHPSIAPTTSSPSNSPLTATPSTSPTTAAPTTAPITTAPTKHPTTSSPTYFPTVSPVIVDITPEDQTLIIAVGASIGGLAVIAGVLSFRFFRAHKAKQEFLNSAKQLHEQNSMMTSNLQPIQATSPNKYKQSTVIGMGNIDRSSKNIASAKLNKVRKSQLQSMRGDDASSIFSSSVVSFNSGSLVSRQPAQTADTNVRLKVIHDFTSEAEDELSCVVGDVLIGIELVGNWYICLNTKASIGLVPVDYLEEITDNSVILATSVNSQISHPSQYQTPIVINEKDDVKF